MAMGAISNQTFMTPPPLTPKPFKFSVTHHHHYHHLTLSTLKHHLSISTPPSASHTDHTHTTLLVESYHQHRALKSLLQTLSNKRTSPLLLLRRHGDLSTEHFWTVVNFLIRSSRTSEILQVFDAWKEIEKSRINEFNYEKIIRCLAEEGLMEEAATAFMEMKGLGLVPSVQTYNSMIIGYANIGKFDDAVLYFNQMKEINLPIESGTYNGLIQACGEHKMYDEIGVCVKKMEEDGCLPDHKTYNLLIQEFAKAGLLTRMERVYRSMRSKKFDLQSSTSIVMLEAYAKFGIVEKMETMLRRMRNSMEPFKEELIRKIASVYIENYMFSRLDDLGDYLTSKIGKTDIVWCLRLLSHACLLSRRGMDSIVKKMEDENVVWNITYVNIFLSVYLKIKDFTHLRMLLSRLADLRVEPDMVTLGILLDAQDFGFDGARILEMWRRRGILYRRVEMDTDPLILTAFGKGVFLRSCEEVYSSLEPEARGKTTWTYMDLIDLVYNVKGRHPFSNEIEKDQELGYDGSSSLR